VQDEEFSRPESSVENSEEDIKQEEVDLKFTSAVEFWTPEEVQSWIDIKFPSLEVGDQLKKKQIDGKRLAEVNADLLSQLGVGANLIPEILNEIQSLQGDSPSKARMDEVQNLLKPSPTEIPAPPPPPSDLLIKKIHSKVKKMSQTLDVHPIEKALPEGEARKFWYEKFGDETCVNTFQFIKTLIGETNLASACTNLIKPHTQLLYTLLQDFVDPDETGDVSVQAFSQLLKLFGPINTCMRTLCKSLVNMQESNNQNIFPWFFLRPMTLRDYQEMQSQGEGTFLISCSMKSASFTLSMVVTNDDDECEVVHESFKYISNGFRIIEDSNNYATLQDLVLNISKLSKPFKPFDHVISLNVSGTNFTLPVKKIMKYKESTLAKLVQRNLYRNHVIRIDCDQGCFRIIRNFLRFDELILPKEVNVRLLYKEAKQLKYYTIIKSLQDEGYVKNHQQNRERKQKSPPVKKKRPTRKKEVPLEQLPFFHGDIDRTLAESRTEKHVGTHDPRYLQGRYLLRSSQSSGSGRVTYILSYFLKGEPQMRHTRLAKRGNQVGIATKDGDFDPKRMCDSFEELRQKYFPGVQHPVPRSI